MFRSFIKRQFLEFFTKEFNPEENFGDESCILHLLDQVNPQNLGIQLSINKKENINDKYNPVS